MHSLSMRTRENCAGPTRREMLRIGGLSSLGLTLPQLWAGQANAATKPKQAKNCIVLFLFGGPPQHSMWDPKPDAPAEVRGEFGPIDTTVPGIRIASCFPQVAKVAKHVCFVRSVSTRDNAHSSSGYYMLTGVPHAPMNSENANPGPPNDWPTFASIIRRLRGDQNGMPASVRLPMHIFNTDGSIWPGQDGGFLGRSADPWLFRCDPALPGFQVPELALVPDVSLERLSERRNLLTQLDREIASRTPTILQQRSRLTSKAFDMLSSAKARQAFDLAREAPALRDQYGRTHFGQSCLLARRLIEAGVGLVHVNWYRGPEEPSNAPVWDTHAQETKRMKTVLAPVADAGIATLIRDLEQRGLLDETLIMVLSEFGRSPRFNGAAGRDHWGSVFSVALAGGGIRGGQVYGSSDQHAAQPRENRVTPQDLTATALHCLGYEPHTEILDTQGRPLPASRGTVIQGVL